MSVCAIVNAVFDLWSFCENKPLWKLLVDMPIDNLMKCIDFQYMSDVITEKEVLLCVYCKKKL